MGRFGTTFLLIAALVIGGVFEVAKRLTWTPARSSTELAGLPLGRVAPVAVDHSRPQLPGQMIRSRNLKAQPLHQKAMLIPRTHGQFDSTTPQVANDQQTVAKTEKEAANKTKKKKCKTKNDQNEQLPQDLARTVRPQPAAPLTVAALAQQARARFNNKDGNKKTEAATNKEVEAEECEEEETEKQVAQEEKPEAEQDEDKKPESNLANNVTNVIGGAGVAAGNAGNEMAGFEEWKARVLDQPNFKETVRLIEAVQSGQISSTLFYAIVKLMFKDSRQEMRELGVLAAGRTPSVESYHLLVDLIKHETFSSKLRQRAEAELNIYEQVTYLWILENVLRSSNDVFSVIWATKQLEDSARRYLNVRYNRPVPGGNGSQTVRNPYLAQFNRFISVLQELSTTKDGAEAASQAKQTLQNLQDLIKAVS